MRSAGGLLSLPVRHKGIDLGRPVDVLLDLESGRALGLEVRCRDESRRFLPLVAAHLGPEAAELASPLALLDDLAFYRARATGLRELLGVAVADGERPLGALLDVLLTERGAMAQLVVDGPRPRRVPYGPRIAFDGARRVSAA